MLIVVLRDFEQLEGMAENVLAYSLYMICLGGNIHLPSFLIYLLSPATVYSLRILETTTRSADGMGSLEELPLHLFIFILSEVKRASGAIVLHC